jgi:hypothetical protein
MQPRPLDLGELDPFRLIAEGMREGVLLPSDDSPAAH